MHPLQQKLLIYKDSSEIAQDLIECLKATDIHAYIYKVAFSGSTYLHFKDKRMGKCRIGNHPERSRYGYRWQIRQDIQKKYEDSSKGHRQFFFPASDLNPIVKRMKQYYSAIQRSNQ